MEIYKISGATRDLTSSVIARDTAVHDRDTLGTSRGSGNLKLPYQDRVEMELASFKRKYVE